MNRDEIFSIPKAARHCDLHRVTLWKYVKAGEIKTFRTPGGQYRIRKADLYKFMQRKGMNLYLLDEPSSKKVLIVDDDPALKRLLGQALSGKGFELEYASDGFEAGLKIIKFQPNMVILDLFMPNMDGFEVCKRLKEASETAKIKIIAISGFDTEETRQRILDCGADLFLPKPLDIKNMKQEIGNILGQFMGTESGHFSITG